MPSGRCRRRKRREPFHVMVMVLLWPLPAPCSPDVSVLGDCWARFLFWWACPSGCCQPCIIFFTLGLRAGSSISDWGSPRQSRAGGQQRKRIRGLVGGSASRHGSGSPCRPSARRLGQARSEKLGSPPGAGRLLPAGPAGRCQSTPCGSGTTGRPVRKAEVRRRTKPEDRRRLGSRRGFSANSG